MGPAGMYVATLILFLIPSSILWLAWRRTFNTRNPPTRQDWRSRCLEAGLIIATFATLTTIGFDLSWTHNGGSPHGMIPRPGLWMILRPIALWCVVATVVLGVFGKGKGRLLVIGSAISIFIADLLLALFEME